MKVVNQGGSPATGGHHRWWQVSSLLYNVIFFLPLMWPSAFLAVSTVQNVVGMWASGLHWVGCPPACHHPIVEVHMPMSGPRVSTTFLPSFKNSITCQVSSYGRWIGRRGWLCHPSRSSSTRLHNPRSSSNNTDLRITSIIITRRGRVRRHSIQHRQQQGGRGSKKRRRSNELSLFLSFPFSSQNPRKRQWKGRKREAGRETERQGRAQGRGGEEGGGREGRWDGWNGHPPTPNPAPVCEGSLHQTPCCCPRLAPTSPCRKQCQPHH